MPDVFSRGCVKDSPLLQAWRVEGLASYLRSLGKSQLSAQGWTNRSFAVLTIGVYSYSTLMLEKKNTLVQRYST
jgi:hypothetical protein